MKGKKREMSGQKPLTPAPQRATDNGQNPAWYNALSLTERAVLSHTIAYRRASKAAVDPKKAAQRVQEWKTQRPFEQGTFFADRLAQDTLDEEELLRLLAEPLTSFQRAYLQLAAPPDWLQRLLTVFQTSDQRENEVEWTLEPSSLAHYLRPIHPLLTTGLKRLNQSIQALRQHTTVMPLEPGKLIEQLFQSLSERLLGAVSKVFVLEMHIARLEGVLEGETSEERFQDFIRQISQEGRMLSLLEEYPVLGRQLVLMIDQWADYMQEFFTHLCADWSEICAAFSPERDPGLLVEIQSGAGDVHRRGRSVLIVKFASGLRVLYKPRSLAVDIHFQELLTWLNEQGVQPSLRTIALIERGDYGWSEFVQAQSCTTQEEIARFFTRQGSYLALLYACNAIDMHLENVIAMGEYPIFVDLEALFHPPMDGNDPMQASYLGQTSIDNSVFRIGLLPCRIWSNKEGLGIDLSGMGGQGGQMTPFALPQWEEAGTDQMRLVRRQMEIAGKQNRPSLNDADVDILAYRAELLQGFSCMYRFLQERRDALRTEILPRFARDEIRLLFRPTRRYANLLRESFHPDLLHDALERDRFFDQLWREVELRPVLKHLLPAERQDLLQGDIPFFKTYPDSHTVFTADDTPLGTFFAATGMDLVHQRLQLLDEQDLARQCWIIEAALSTLLIGPERVTGRVLDIKPTNQRASGQDLIAAAWAAGNRLETLAVRNDLGAIWLGVSAVEDQTWSLLPTENDLYNGTSGIALFLGYLGALTAETRYTELAHLSLAAVRMQVEQQKKGRALAGLGAFNGLGSPLYLLTHMSVLWQDPILLCEAEALVELLPDLIARDRTLDIVGGVAGCILALLGLYTVHANPQTLAVACLCGEHLLQTAQPMERGVAWKTIPNEKPLGGFAHGTAGIALSLLKLAHASGDQRYYQTALDALAYDRSLYRPAEQNWADLRALAAQLARGRREQLAGEEQTDVSSTMIAWCHGAAGIGLGRIGGLSCMDDELVRQEIEIAVKTTAERGFKDNHSLCHGALGNLELLLMADQTLKEPHYHALLTDVTAMVLESITTCGWVAGVPLGIETPGLMTGLAGIGYELLRLAEPTRVPSVLLLEPPPGPYTFL